MEGSDDEPEVLDALELNATVTAGGVSIHMDGDSDAELTIEGPMEGGEVHDGQVYHVTLRGEQNGVSSGIEFWLPFDAIQNALWEDGPNHRLVLAEPSEQPAPAPWDDEFDDDGDDEGGDER